MTEPLRDALSEMYYAMYQDKRYNTPSGGGATAVPGYALPVTPPDPFVSGKA